MKKRSSAKSQKSSHDASFSVNPQWAWHYRTLSALRAHLMEEQQEQLQETSQPLEPVRTHLAERGADEFDRDLILTLLAREHNALAEVDAALERIQKGSYGICEMTGAPIPPERLRAVPWTRYVRAIEEQAEKTGHPPTFFPT